MLEREGVFRFTVPHMPVILSKYIIKSKKTVKIIIFHYGTNEV